MKVRSNILFVTFLSIPSHNLISVVIGPGPEQVFLTFNPLLHSHLTPLTGS